jgi:hypothetical protein
MQFIQLPHPTSNEDHQTFRQRSDIQAKIIFMSHKGSVMKICAFLKEKREAPKAALQFDQTNVFEMLG